MPGELKTLYLRGVPEELVRRAKASAAARGMTLVSFVTEALAEKLDGRSLDTGALAGDVAWYEANRTRLLSRYRGEYIAVRNGEVLDHDRNFESLARRVFTNLGTRPVFMPRCDEEPEIVDIPSPLSAEG